MEMGSRPISRVLSWTVIPLGAASPQRSSNLPGSSAGHAIGSLFGLAPSGVYLATHCCQARGALLPHPFTLTSLERLRRSTLCCTFRRLTPPRRYLALCPMEPGLSSPKQPLLAYILAATVWPTPAASIPAPCRRLNAHLSMLAILRTTPAFDRPAFLQLRPHPA